MLGHTHREEREEEHAMKLAHEQAAEAVDASETDDAEFDSNERVEEQVERDDVREN